MKGSLVLGVIGGIIAIIIGATLLTIGNINNQMYPLLSVNIAGAICIVAAIIGFVGAFMGKKAGGALMIIAGIISIVGGVGAFLSFILLLVGGILALREKS